MVDISSLGLSIFIRAIPLFPTGFTLTQFADDGDSIDIPEIEIMNTAMGPNGDLVVWRVPNPIRININLIPGTDDVRNMERLLNFNMTTKNRAASKDVVSATVNHPNGDKTTFKLGAIIAGKVAQDYAASGRAKTRQFSLIFEAMPLN